jgi:hypothetical protein
MEATAISLFCGEFSLFFEKITGEQVSKSVKCFPSVKVLVYVGFEHS